jgi:putative endonuclease
MATDVRRATGDLGERLAERHLAWQGYEVIERNYRSRYGELDLIAADDRSIVFCEVKTRIGSGRRGPAHPLEAIGPRKRRQVRAMAREWLHERSRGGGHPFREHIRFDAIGVTLAPNGALLRLEHVPDAF